MQTNKKKLWILLGVLAVIIIIIVIATANSKKTTQAPVVNTGANTTATTDANKNLPTNPGNGTSTSIVATTTFVTSQALKDAVVIVPGANPVTKANQVVTPTGMVAENNSVPNTPTAPHQTEPIASVSTLPAQVIKVSISEAAGIVPKEFTVKAGAPTTIAFSSVDSSPHTVLFDDSSLSAIAAGLGPNVTRAITFNAPTKPGKYTYRCIFAGHADRGEVGTMIVQ